MRFLGEKLNGWSDKVEIFVTFRSKYLQKNDQNSVFVSEAIHGEIFIWNNQMFEEGYLSQLLDLPFNSSPNHAIACEAKDKVHRRFQGELQWKWKWSNISFKYLSSEIMELEKNEGWGTHFGILSYWHFAMGIDA